jgi:hypothetical protein
LDALLPYSRVPLTPSAAVTARTVIARILMSTQSEHCRTGAGPQPPRCLAGLVPAIRPFIERAMSEGVWYHAELRLERILLLAAPTRHVAILSVALERLDRPVEEIDHAREGPGHRFVARIMLRSQR